MLRYLGSGGGRFNHGYGHDAGVQVQVQVDESGELWKEGERWDMGYTVLMNGGWAVGVVVGEAVCEKGEGHLVVGGREDVGIIAAS